MQIELSDRRLLVDGRSRILMSGEVHYFRLDRADWDDRLRSLGEAGCTTVATYMPWIWHELPDGSFDVDGRTRPERDLAAFCDLAASHGLLVLARPGPCVMAELKNEGLPHRLYREHPELHPLSWDGVRARPHTIDYLSPDFLAAVRDWYRAVNAVLAPRLVTHGGPVMGYQLDNEIGMLAWVTNSPDLTDVVLADFASWLGTRYDAGTLAGRYLFDLGDAETRAKALRSPSDGYATALLRDLGHYMRDRFARYVDTLRAYAEEDGVGGVPFLVNVHGTGGGRGRDYPIGISQLYRSYRGKPGITSGSDYYLGDLTVGNLPDLYLGNAFMAAVHDADQPLTSLEFEAGKGDYGEDLGVLFDPASVELKTRLCVAQGNRLVNYYLFTGGYNPPLDEPVGDGNDRIAFTGERHGFAAPVDPEGRPGLTYEPTARTVAAVNGVEPLLAGMREEHDDFAYAFVPDQFMTEYHYPGSDAATALVDDLTRFRGAGQRDVLARALLLGGFSFGSLDVQDSALDPATTPALVLTSASHMDPALQERLGAYVRAGGRLLLGGVVPTLDMEGSACTLLADGLGLTVLGRRDDEAPTYFPSVRPSEALLRAVPTAEPGATERVRSHAETRVSYAQLLQGPAGATPLLTEVGSGEVCALSLPAGDGRVVVLGGDYPCDVEVYRALMGLLGVTPRLGHDATAPGVVTTTTVDDAGQRLLHLLNVSPYPTTLALSRDGRPLLDGHRLTLGARSGLMLPLDVRLDGATLAWTTAELVGPPGREGVGTPDGAAVTLRPTQPDEDVAVLVTSRGVSSDAPVEVHRDGERVEVRFRRSALDGDAVALRLA